MTAVAARRPWPDCLTALVLCTLAGLAGAACRGTGAPVGPPATALAAVGDTSAPVPGCSNPGPLVAPSVPVSVMAPARAQLMLRLRAQGDQIYTCQATASGGWAFVLKAPDARLINDQCLVVGSHFAGPTWALRGDGGRITGKKLAQAPAAADAIPWLLLEATAAVPTGVLAQARFIQRIDTLGGVAPTSGCDASRAGGELVIPYSATYLFYAAPGI